MIDVTIPFDHIAYRVPKGHRIRIAVSTSYWPLLWPSPESATIQLDAGTLDLPTRQSGSKNERDFAEPEAETPWNTEVVRQASNSRKQTTDLATGLVTLEIIDDFGSVKDNDHGLINGSVAREWWHIHPDDPLSASAQTHWTTYNARDDWSVRTETYASMRSDAGQFYLTARLEAYEGDALIYEKDLEHSVQRDYR
jgi:hypothetical protein